MITLNGKEIKITEFPNRESHIDSNDIDLTQDNFDIGFKYKSDSDLIRLMFVKKHLDRLGKNTILRIYYMPYSRMDRTENKKVFTLKYVSEFINSLGFNKVYIYQPHSDVCIALINNSIQVNVTKKILDLAMEELKFNKHIDYIYYPDVSAEKHFGNDEYKSLTGIKKRDFDSGNITNLDVIGDIPKEKGFRVLMVDDLSSFGGTFQRGAKRLKDLGAGDIYLIVAHAEESINKGYMFQNDLIKKVFTTNSIIDLSEETDRMKIFNISEMEV